MLPEQRIALDGELSLATTRHHRGGYSVNATAPEGQMLTASRTAS